MQKIAALIVAVFTILVSLPAYAALPPLPGIEAEAACVMEVNTKKVLFGKDEAKIMYPASTTKIMTLMVALEKGKLADPVTVSSRAASFGEASMELNPGDRLTLKDLLYGIMLASGNDAAEAVAEHVGGGNPDTFIGWMNEKAQKIGTANTHFSNPHGLPDPINHYTTAYDLALITSQGFANPQFTAFTNVPKKDVVLASGRKIHMETYNRFLGMYQGANGVKTGFTNDAGLCVVASAKRNDVQLIAVVLNSDNRWNDAKKLLDYGFESYEQASTKLVAPKPKGGK